MAHPFVPALRVLELRFIWDNQGQVANNYAYVYRDSAIWTSSNVASRHTAILAWFNTYLKPLMAPGTSLTRIDYRDLTTSTSYSATKPVTPAIPGTSGGVDMPQNATLSVRWYTDTRGRSYTGRWFLVGLPLGYQSRGVLLDAKVYDYQNCFAQLLSVNSALGLHPVIVSTMSGGAWRTNAVVTYIVGAQVDRNLDSQRMRLPGR